MSAFDDDGLDNEYFGEEPVTMEEGFECVVIVDGLPKVPVAKFAKLQQFFEKRVLSTWGKVVELHIPCDEQTTSGVALVQFATREEAETAVRMGDRHQFDKRHTLRVNFYDDYENRFANVPDTFEEYERREEEAKAQADANEQKGAVGFSAYMTDPKARDQYLVRAGADLQVWWNDPYLPAEENGRTLVYGGEDQARKGKQWTESYAGWSTRGTFLATFHRQGIGLWGGERFARIARFPHPGVRLVLFSPCENYLITCNGHIPESKDEPDCLIVWQVQTGKLLRGWRDFGGAAFEWPLLKWSHDDRYLARVGKNKKNEDCIQVYSVPEMTLVDKKPMRVRGVREVQWSPGAHVLSYHVPSIGEAPARVSLVAWPSREVLREKHLFNVADIKMHWQSQGKYLCVKMTRHKTKRTLVTDFEVFRLHGKNVPLEMIELEDKIVAFAWEPAGDRFAIVHNDGRNTHVSFYKVGRRAVELVHKLENKDCNNLFWSPRGGVICLAGLGGLGGQLEFYDVPNKRTLAQREHHMCTAVEWDPSGRYVITSVRQPLDSAEKYKYAMENGYKVWVYDPKHLGGELFVPSTDIMLEECYQVLWRPRRPTLLTRDDEYKVKSEMKEVHGKELEEEDEATRRGALDANERQRLQQQDQWRQYRSQRDREYKSKEMRKARADLRECGSDDDDDDDEYTTIVEEVEVNVEVKEEFL